MINLDKIQHAIVGFLIVLAYSLAGSTRDGLCGAVIIGLLKEVYDYFRPQSHTCDGLDALSTIVGALVASAILK